MLKRGKKVKEKERIKVDQAKTRMKLKLAINTFY
jgi:hypothetical protein